MLSRDRAEAVLDLPSGRLQLPAFLPDATLGVVRSVDADDLARCDIQAVVMNTFHLMQRPGSSTIRALGGLHAMCGWERPIITDSGGFQAYSLISENSKNGRVTDNGILFRPAREVRKYSLTPEKTVQLQLSYGTDVVICLDDCTHIDAPDRVQEDAVRRTVDWARRCKAEYGRIVEQRGIPPERRPPLFAVIQGGGSRELRKRCADQLLEVGFDGFGYGGWPLDSRGNLLADLLAYTRELVPLNLPMHALGVGHPLNVLACARMGYDLFDSALPTRDARQGRLYDIASSPAEGSEEGWFSFTYIADDKYIKADRPISGACDCLCCARYSLGYLRHLFKIEDSLYLRLATIHNLRSMTRLTEYLREMRRGQGE